MVTPFSSSEHRSLVVQHIAWLAGTVALSLILGVWTSVFDVLLGGIAPGSTTLMGVLASTLLIATGRLIWCSTSLAAYPPDLNEAPSFAALNPHPVLEITTAGDVIYCNPAAATLCPDLEATGETHLFLQGLGEEAAGLPHGKRRHVVREVSVGETVYEQHILPIPGTNRVRVYGTNITPRKHAAEAQAQSEERFTRVFRSAPMAISISHLSDGRFVDVNESFVRLLGHLDHHAIIGHSAKELGMWVRGDERAQVLETLSDENAALYSIEAQVLRRDGRVRDVIMSVEMMEFDGAACVVTTMFDVTEYKEAESGIAVLKSFYENTLRELPIQVAVLDSEARFFYMNPEALRDEDLRLWMVGKTSIEYARAQGVPEAPYRRRHKWLLDVIARKEISQIEETLTTFSGEERHVLRVATPVLDENDDVGHLVGYGIDITDRKEFEQKLLEAKHAAEEMARLKSAFVANMSHEVRTPLTAILGFAAVLGEELEGEQRELIDIIRQSGERLLETLNSVLDLARLEANALPIDPKLLDLTQEIQDAAQIYRPVAKRKGLAFQLDTPDHAVEAQVDRASLHRVVSNLLSNAIKFTDKGEIRLHLRLVGSDVEIRVEDTGLGISDAFLPHLFEEFKQESTGLSRTHTGSGLGLAITKHLVERMHGRIEVKSVKNQGSTFIVRFPIIFPGPSTSPPKVHESATPYWPAELFEN